MTFTGPVQLTASIAWRMASVGLVTVSDLQRHSNSLRSLPAACGSKGKDWVGPEFARSPHNGLHGSTSFLQRFLVAADGPPQCHFCRL